MMRFMAWVALLGCSASIHCALVRSDPSHDPERVPPPAEVKMKMDIHPPGPTDAGSDLVVAFYAALLQDEAPTLRQEQMLFHHDSSLRNWLLQKRGLRDDQPARLLWFREHRQDFIPRNTKSLHEVQICVQISSMFNFIRSLDHVKPQPQPGYGDVLAFFADDRGAAHRKIEPSSSGSLPGR